MNVMLAVAVAASVVHLWRVLTQDVPATQPVTVVVTSVPAGSA